MGLFGNLFGSGSKVSIPLKWDMHNHILFGIDDGSKTIENSVEMAKLYIDSGYKHVIATPHVMSDYYPNNREIISAKADELNKALNEKGLNLPVTIAAEYYMDEVFFEKINSGEQLLCFHGRHVLMETSFMNKPMFFSKLVFELKTRGYIPVFAHPERYVYLQNDYEEAEKLLQLGLKFQINLLSLAGYYSPMVKKLAQWLIKNGHYSFLGTDAHSLDHLKLLPGVFKSRTFNSIDFDKVENCSEMH